jgi:uncharacterized protein YegP (UPF0339 family)
MRNRAVLFFLGVVSIVLIILTTIFPVIDPTLQTLVLIIGIVLNLLIIILFVFIKDKASAKTASVPSQTIVSKSRYKFEIYRDKGGEFRFNVVAANGEIVASSEGYTSKAGCLNGIDSIKENATHARIEDTTKED